VRVENKDDDSVSRSNENRSTKQTDDVPSPAAKHINRDLKALQDYNTLGHKEGKRSAKRTDGVPSPAAKRVNRDLRVL